MGLVVSRETQHMGVPYYVDKRFEKEYHGAALDELEKAIESDYIEYLQNSCWKEKQQSKPASRWLKAAIDISAPFIALFVFASDQNCVLRARCTLSLHL